MFICNINQSFAPHFWNKNTWLLVLVFLTMACNANWNRKQGAEVSPKEAFNFFNLGLEHFYSALKFTFRSLNGKFKFIAKLPVIFRNYFSRPSYVTFLKNTASVIKKLWKKALDLAHSAIKYDKINHIWWYTFIILTLWETEARKSQVQAELGQFILAGPSLKKEEGLGI